MAQVNFHRAARRHFRDAAVLRHQGSAAGAGQLHGFAAECGIKALLVWLGYPTDPQTGDIKSGEKLRKHVHELVGPQQWSTLTQLAQGRQGSKYLASIPNLSKFADWHTDHRYYDDAQISPSFAAWQDAAEEVMQMLDEMVTDGASS